MNGPETSPLPLLAVRGLTRAFAGGRARFGRPRDVVRAVTDVSLDLPAGQTLGIVGESGSGKSTLGRLALRMIEADSGDIRFDGRDLRAASPRELRRFRSGALARGSIPPQGVRCREKKCLKVCPPRADSPVMPASSAFPAPSRP